MIGLQVCVSCLLLRMAAESVFAVTIRLVCQPCDRGYFVKQNCSGGNGVQCSPCTKCSAAGQDTLVQCSTFADSVCGSRQDSFVTTLKPPEEPTATVSAQERWVLATAIVPVVLLLLLGLILTWLCCWSSRRSQLKDLDPL